MKNLKNVFERPHIICGVKVRTGDVITIKEKHSPSYLTDGYEIIGFTSTNVNFKNCSVPIDWITEVKHHHNIEDAIKYANTQYASKGAVLC